MPDTYTLTIQGQDYDVAWPNGAPPPNPDQIAAIAKQMGLGPKAEAPNVGHFTDPGYRSGAPSAPPFDPTTSTAYSHGASASPKAKRSAQPAQGVGGISDPGYRTPEKLGPKTPPGFASPGTTYVLPRLRDPGYRSEKDARFYLDKMNAEDAAAAAVPGHQTASDALGKIMGGDLSPETLDQFVSHAGDLALEGARSGVAPVAAVQKKLMPTGIFKPQFYTNLGKLGVGGKTMAATMQNLDPTLMPGFIEQLATAGGARATADHVQGLFKKIASGAPDAEQAGAEILGMFNALAGGKALHGVLGEEHPSGVPKGNARALAKNAVGAPYGEAPTTPPIEGPVEGPDLHEGVPGMPVDTHQVKVPGGSEKFHVTRKIVELGDPVASHDYNGVPNPDYPRGTSAEQDLQLRDRSKPGYAAQVDKMARTLRPEDLIEPDPTVDRGAPKITKDGVVNQGNGRMAAIRKAHDFYPDRYEAYKQALVARYPEAKNFQNPVLVEQFGDLVPGEETKIGQQGTVGEPKPTPPVGEGVSNVESSTTKEGGPGPATPESQIGGDQQGAPRPQTVAPSENLGGSESSLGLNKKPALAPPRELQMSVVPGAKEFVEQDVIPLAERAVDKVRGMMEDFKGTFGPANIGEAAAKTARAGRAALGELAAKRERAAFAVRQIRASFDKSSVADSREFIARMESGAKQKNPALDAVADMFRELLDGRRDTIRALGKGQLENFIANYFPHIWKEPKEGTILGRFFGKRPLEGSKAFLRKRSLDTFQAGIDLGLDPVTENPAELVLLKLHEMDRYLMAQRWMGQLKDQGIAKFVRAAEKPPEGYTKIDDSIARVTEVRPTTKVSGDPGAPEFIVRGHYYAPDGAAKVMNNHLAPGLRGKALYDVLSGTNNMLNQAQLGMSAFHLMFVTLDSSTSGMALGLRQLTTGDVVGGLKNVAKASTLVWKPVENIIRGSGLRNAYLRGGSYGGLVQTLEDAGGRINMDRQYHNNAIASFQKALRTGNYPGAAIRAIPAAFEAASAPIMGVIVPRMKLGVFDDMAEAELKRLGPGVTEDVRNRSLAQIWDSVDNRMGQLVYDNLFWDKTAKDLAHLGTRSVGWNLGTIRELGGAPIDAVTTLKRLKAGDPVLSHRLAYAIALPVTVGTAGAIYQYLSTGQGPQEIRDYFQPKTGRDNQDGTPERVVFASYMKDVASYTDHPITTLGHKAAPWIGALTQSWQNEDFYGNPIRNEDDPLVEQVKQQLGYIADQFKPFSVRNVERLEETDAPLRQKIEAFLGIVPVPQARVEISYAEKVRREGLHKLKIAKDLGATGSGKRDPRQRALAPRR